MNAILKELKTEFNAYDEALLAQRISEHTSSLVAVHKVSQAMFLVIPDLCY